MLHSLLIGALAGQRALTPIAAVSVVAARGELPNDNGAPLLLGRPWVSAGLLALAVAEMVGDKWRKAPDRTVLSGSTARFLTAALAGAALAPRAQRRKAALGAGLTAFAASHLGLAARLRAMRRWSQARTGFVEDALVLAGSSAVALGAARRRST